MAKIKQQAQNPLILRCHRLMDAFAKSDDERDFYLDRLEGFLIYVDLDKPDPDLESFDHELDNNSDRYCLIPKLTYYETKKIMEGFVNEKVYDIDTKEKLLDIIQSKEARENFLEFIYDHHTELEKWQQYYQERSRIRIIEWLRNNHFHFVFEEDLDLPKIIVEKLKQSLFQPKVAKDIDAARKTLFSKAKTYYSSEALNPRPKRGRPPKQIVKAEVEPQFSSDIFTTVPPKVRPLLFVPDVSSLSVSAFSSKFEGEDALVAQKRAMALDTNPESLNQKLAVLRNLSSRWMMDEAKPTKAKEIDFSIDDEEDEDLDDFEDEELIKKVKVKRPPPKKKAPPPKAKAKPAKKSSPKPPSKPTKPKAKRIIPVIKGKKSKPVIQSKPYKRPLKKIMKRK